jgi:hypothetical protein
MKKSIISTNPGRSLSNISFYQFIVSQVSHINELGDAVLTDADLRQIIATLLSFVEDFNKAILQVQKSIKTGDIITLKQARDKSFSALKAGIKNAQFLSDADILRAAAGLTILIKTCGNITRMPLESGSGTAGRLIEELEDTTYKPMVDKLALSAAVARLKKDNNSLVALYESRRDDYLSKDTVKSVDLRKSVTSQYQLLCSYILLKMRLSDDAQYHEALQIINTIRKEYAEVVARHKTARKNRKKAAKSNQASDES